MPFMSDIILKNLYLVLICNKKKNNNEISFFFDIEKMF